MPTSEWESVRDAHSFVNQTVPPLIGGLFIKSKEPLVYKVLPKAYQLFSHK